MSYDPLVEYDESTDPYYATRQFLDPQYRYLPTEEVESLLIETFPDLSPEEAESFFRNIGRSLGKVGREIGRRAPGIVSGAVTGATTGAALGPFGALGGAIAGGTLGGVTYRPQPGTSATNIARQVGGQALGALGRRGGTAGLIGQVGQTAMGALSRGQHGARGQLAALLAQPQTQQAVLNALAGNAGSRSVRVGNQSLPIQSILAALGTLATRVAEEYEMVGERIDTLSSESVFDPANPDEQSSYILETLYQANESLFIEDDEAFYDDETFDDETFDDEDDERYNDYDEVVEFDESFYEMLDDFEYAEA
ncbi:hypothetical protein [Myxacorys almedinensis]|uniref:Uncharacterized protein n=1 Tax=Myxacorys almedinensis A TaxID=2690445 RepID=A0A8J7Z6M5_9CYAN|nr:hypothetical protein [Myxacorys almedinensis]NDJ16440.1 hypothetical protein [Myxacorys almedinensis A]